VDRRGSNNINCISYGQVSPMIKKSRFGLLVKSLTFWQGLTMAVVGELYSRPELMDAILPPQYRGLALSITGIIFVMMRYLQTPSK